MTCLSAKICKHAKDCDIHMCSNTIEKCRAFNRKPNNNEEWLRSCTTDELAGAIYEWYSLGYTRHRIGRKLDDATIVLEWLKEIHND